MKTVCKYSLLLVAAISLTACNNSRTKIDKEKATEIAYSISDSLKEIYPFECVYNTERYDEYTNVRTKKQEKRIYKNKITRKATAKNCYFDRTEVELTADGTKSSGWLESYFIPHNVEDSYVIYTKGNLNTGKEVVQEAKVVHDVEGTNFLDAVTYTSSGLAQENGRFFLAIDSYNPRYQINHYLSATPKDNNYIEYYTQNNNDITMKTHSEYTESGADIKVDFEISYSEKGFVGLKEIKKINGKVNRKVTITVKYTNSVKVSLPKDWEKYIVSENA